ncbi:MAG: hypothetical protein JXA68_05175 [Ignavibacteriales bacterium]|nr:hypothetical protein [Ignavibacteriales bacterium]
MTKKTFIHTVFIVVISLVILLGYVLIVSKIKSLTLEKQILTEILYKNENQVNILSVEIQKLSTQERIVYIAVNKLGLIQSTEPFEDILVIDKDKLNRIVKIVNE